jgi:hypothetical protein
VEPLPRFQLSFSRLIQWGGSVGGDGLDALGDAILGRSNDPNGAVNNEIAGFDLRYTWLPGGNPLTLYGQFIGEDEANKAPTRIPQPGGPCSSSTPGPAPGCSGTWNPPTPWPTAFSV